MLRRMFVFILAILMMLCLCSCQLAKPDAEGTEESGRLAGVFITTEPLGSLDAETFLQENLSDILVGETVSLEFQNTLGRIYAEKVDEVVTDGDGAEHRVTSYKFPGLDGMMLLRFIVESPQGPYSTSAADPEICDVNSWVGGSEEGISGTIWMAEGSGEAIYYMHPVYQTESGAVYLLPGAGIHVSADAGIQASQSYSENISLTEDGEQIDRTFKVEVNIDFAKPAEMVTLIQMDEQHQVIRTESFKVDETPNVYSTAENTAYIIVEIHSGEAVERFIVDPNEENIRFFVNLTEQICTRKSIKVQ